MLLEEYIESVQGFHEPILETDLRSFTRHSKRFLWHPCWIEARWRRMTPTSRAMSRSGNFLPGNCRKQPNSAEHVRDCSSPIGILYTLAVPVSSS